jgi:hypothetical protein
VTVTKSVEKNRPLTICKLTPSGRRRFVDYLDVLEALVRDAREETMATLSPRMSKA